MCIYINIGVRLCRSGGAVVVWTGGRWRSNRRVSSYIHCPKAIYSEQKSEERRAAFSGSTFSLESYISYFLIIRYL